MLHSLKDLEGYALSATDGEIGQVSDFYFDEHEWVVRYLVVKTSSWLPGRKVLIAAQAIGTPNAQEKLLPANLTQEQVRNSPDIDTEQPVSRQHESQYLSYYGYPQYWGSVSVLGGDTSEMFPLPGLVTEEGSERVQRAAPLGTLPEATPQGDQDQHLHSCNEVAGYHVHATDGEIGHVEGFLVDESDWTIRYLIVNTSNWWLGHKVLLAPQWFTDVNWQDGSIAVMLSQQSVQDAPVYESTEALNREREEQLYAHYKRDAYWPQEPGERETERTRSNSGLG